MATTPPTIKLDVPWLDGLTADIRHLTEALDANDNTTAGIAVRAIQLMREAGEERDHNAAERDGAYRERAQLLALLATQYPAVIAPAPDIDTPGWHLLYLTVGGRQCSWHIAPRDSDLFAHIEHVDADSLRAQWDGHTTEQKYARIADHIAHRDFTPPAHYQRSDGVENCVHQIPVGPDSCWDCRDLAGLADGSAR